MRMRSRLPLILVSVLAAGLGACAGPRAPLTATPNGYTVAIDDDVDELAEATGKAQIHCAQYGRAARLDTIGEIDGKRIASFSCTEN